MASKEICRIPVSATYAEINGEMVMVSAEYKDIPAEVIAKFLIEKFGASAIFGEGESE